MDGGSSCYFIDILTHDVKNENSLQVGKRRWEEVGKDQKFRTLEEGLETSTKTYLAEIVLVERVEYLSHPSPDQEAHEISDQVSEIDVNVWRTKSADERLNLDDHDDTLRSLLT